MQNVHVPALARRMKEQEWIYDRLIAAGGADFYWPMTEETLCTVGMDGSADIKSVRGGIKRVAHITREMVRIAQKRESMAKEAEAEGHLITAGKNYFMAAAYYTMSQGPIHGEHPLNHQLSEKKKCLLRQLHAICNAPRTCCRYPIWEQVTSCIPAFATPCQRPMPMRGIFRWYG